MTKKIEAFWVDATAGDVARVMNGEDVEARFRDRDNDEWCSPVDQLAGYDSTEEACWIDQTGCPWRHCQVYREPDWYANKPDPGFGYRLLEKFPDEPKVATDDAWDVKICEWRVTSIDDGIQNEEVWYRRRIEPVDPTQQFDRRVFLQVGDRVRHPSGFLVVVTEKGFEVTQ